ncbi:AcrR family transcriptional regulator [Allocatelliglobosispora scoriae]|uniref:AcrR family transcriptional regulator n=1 Tax=Allocatelliglobosispora scoriae TaxID=643052 RepID=A0A841BL84_9ACTN|nr:TetR/AcrR family transcriptional regulator [Allocatelliglobosispora scoriae]MBB5867959.1 AcrR family transcriptional regulator [Allocatelliglobosispora scoriae]
MTADSPGPTKAVVASAADEPAAHRPRDAARTRQLLLDSARRRFAHDGYSATTVRDIADDAGVNVALISRYFGSKEGLFEACLVSATEELKRVAGTVSGASKVPDAIVKQVLGAAPGELPNEVLMLLLRSSGDERAERMRVGLLRTFTERLASTAGWHADDPGGDDLMLRSQLVLALALGVTVLRATSGLEPLASATEEDLTGPMRDLVAALMPQVP